MTLNPFRIVGSRGGEDQVTFALCTALDAGGAPAVTSLLQALGANTPHGAGTAQIDVQYYGAESRPDARIELPDGTTILFENKIVIGKLYEQQICDHLKSFGSARPSAAKILLAVTPDLNPPSWWTLLAKRTPHIQFVFASWQTVTQWARRRIQEEIGGELALFLLNALVEYLEEEVGIGMKKAAFDPQTMARVAKESSKWLEDLENQHAAQEALLHDVADLLRSTLGSSDLWVKVDSRWGKTWTPVSTYMEFWWPTLQMDDMKDTHLWTEIYLDEETGEIKLRTGVLFTGKAQVAGWHGIAKEVTETIFQNRSSNYRSGGAYAEVWALLPLEIERLDNTKSAIVKDLVCWVNKALPAMAKRKQ